MILIDNPYSRGYEFLAQSHWREDYKLEEFLLPSLRLQSSAFRDGALVQLLACVDDLRLWAAQFRVLGKADSQKSWINSPATGRKKESVT